MEHAQRKTPQPWRALRVTGGPMGPAIQPAQRKSSPSSHERESPTVPAQNRPPLSTQRPLIRLAGQAPLKHRSPPSREKEAEKPERSPLQAGV